MEKKIKVEKLVLTIGKKELVLTVDEAKELQSALNDLFKTTNTVIHTREVVREPAYKPYWDQIRYNGLSSTSIKNSDLQYKYQSQAFDMQLLALGKEDE